VFTTLFSSIAQDPDGIVAALEWLPDMFVEVWQHYNPRMSGYGSGFESLPPSQLISKAHSSPLGMDASLGRFLTGLRQPRDGL
jgi:hypothetical protein